MASFFLQHFARRLYVFLVFNIIPRHTDPLGRYAGDIERLAVI